MAGPASPVLGGRGDLGSGSGAERAAPPCCMREVIDEGFDADDLEAGGSDSFGDEGDFGVKDFEDDEDDYSAG
eukprot:778377-Alexandrium_andersonii.AAC.1